MSVSGNGFTGYRGVLAMVDLTNRRVSLSRGEADVALRLARPREDNVVTRRLSSIPLALFAARSYLEKHGQPGRPKEAKRKDEEVESLIVEIPHKAGFYLTQESWRRTMLDVKLEVAEAFVTVLRATRLVETSTSPSRTTTSSSPPVT